MSDRYAVRLKTVTLRVSDNTRGDVAGDPETCVATLRAIFADLDADQEHFVILALDAKNRTRGFKVLFSGGETSSVVSPAVTFRAALVLGAVSIVVAHNHPSGDPTPSREDIACTKNLRECGLMLGVHVVDHIVLGDGTDRYASFHRLGL